MSVTWHFVLCALLLLASGCANGPVDNSSNSNTNNNSTNGSNDRKVRKPPVELPEAKDFIVDRQLVEKKVTLPNGKVERQIVDQGPLRYYLVQLDTLLDHEQTKIGEERDQASTSSRKRRDTIRADTVLFSLPGTGDTGPSFERTKARIDEMVLEGTLPAISQLEYIEPGTVAQVELETPGYPSGLKRGDHVPVVVSPLGNATGLVGGKFFSDYLYLTADIRDKVQNTAQASLNTITAEDVVDPNVYFEASTTKNLEGRPTRYAAGSILLPRRFKLTRDVAWDEPNRSFIRVVLVETKKYTRNSKMVAEREPADDVTVRAAIESIQARFPSFKVQQTGLGNRGNVIEVVPTFAPALAAGESRKRYSFDGDLDRLYDEVRTLGVKRTPRNALHIIADLNLGRVLVVGREEWKRLAGKLEFGRRSADSPNEYRPSGDFRMIVEPVDARKSLRVQWSRLENDRVVEKGETTIANDIVGLLRYAYSKGCDVWDCLAIIILADHKHRISARLLENPERFKPRILEDE